LSDGKGAADQYIYISNGVPHAIPLMWQQLHTIIASVSLIGMGFYLLFAVGIDEPATESAYQMTHSAFPHVVA